RSAANLRKKGAPDSGISPKSPKSLFLSSNRPLRHKFRTEEAKVRFLRVLASLLTVFRLPRAKIRSLALFGRRFRRIPRRRQTTQRESRFSRHYPQFDA